MLVLKRKVFGSKLPVQATETLAICNLLVLLTKECVKALIQAMLRLSQHCATPGASQGSQILEEYIQQAKLFTMLVREHQGVCLIRTES